jgi:hypothetical protein
LIEECRIIKENLAAGRMRIGYRRREPLKDGFNNVNFSYEKVQDALSSPCFEGKFIVAVVKLNGPML